MRSVARESPIRLRYSTVSFIEINSHYYLRIARWRRVGATFNTTQHLVDLTLGTASGQSIIRQSFQYHRYQPGKSQLVLCTGVLGAIKANVRKRVGYFDANNGLFLKVAGTYVAVVQRNNASDAARVVQASWNIDKMDGTGPSGVTIDWSRSQILAIDLEWLGVGAARFAMVVNGIIYPVHQFQNANVVTSTYMQTANLPIRYEITNTGTAASGTTLKQICCSVQSEGGFNPLGIGRVARTAAAGKSLNTGSLRPLISIRLKSGDIRSQVVPAVASFTASSAQEYLVVLTVNGSLTSPTWTSLGPNSIVEIDTAATAISGGYEAEASVGSRDSSTVIPLDGVPRLGASVSGTSDILTLSALQRSGGAATAFASLNFTELF